MDKPPAYADSAKVGSSSDQSRNFDTIDVCSMVNLNGSAANSATNRYGPGDETSLDSILANVHRLMNYLNVVEIDDMPLTSSDLVAMTMKNPETPRTVDDLLFELCGSSEEKGLENEPTVGDPNERDPSSHDKTLARNSLAPTDQIHSVLRRASSEEERKVVIDLYARLAACKASESTQMTDNGKNEELSCDENSEGVNSINKQEAMGSSKRSQTRIDSIQGKNGLNESLEKDLNEKKDKPRSNSARDEASDLEFAIEPTGAENKVLKKAHSDMSNYTSSKAKVESDDEQIPPSFHTSSSSGHSAVKKEKKKLHFALSLPDKLPINKRTQKESQTHQFKLFPLKRKSSRDRVQADLKNLSSNGADCSCFGLTDDGHSRQNSIFEIEKSTSISTADDSNSNKNVQQDAVVRRKNSKSKDKKFRLSFRRSQSLEGKKTLADFGLETTSSSDSKNLSLDDPKSPVAPSSSPLTRRKNSKLLQAAQAAGLGSFGKKEKVKLTYSRSLSGSPQLNQLNRKNIPTILFNDCAMESTGRVDSEPKLPRSRSDFDEGGTVEKRRRATMDSAPSRSKFMDFVHGRKETTHHHASNNASYSSLSMKQRNRGVKPHIGSLPSPHAISVDSDGSQKGSEESLEDENSLKNSALSRHHRVGGIVDNALSEQQIEYLKSRMPKPGKKNILRKSMKYVGKSASIATHEHSDVSGGRKQDNAERTWIHFSECSWRNMSGDRVEIESTCLQELSELECDVLRKVSLSRLNEENFGVAIVVPKDESKILNRKVSIKKRYAMHLPTKDKNKEKNVDHVFGIPLVSVVENDQLLRLQKSSSFTPPPDCQHADLDSPSSNAQQCPNSGLSSVDSSCSGSTTSIPNNQAPASNDEEAEACDRPLVKAPSSDHINTPKVPTKLVDNESLLIKEQVNQARSSTPTPTRANQTASIQPLRRRGAIGADLTKQIDSSQSQLLEALSLSGTTQSQRKEKKRSLLPPTMPQVPYIVQKCCDHLRKYGLDQTGIFRLAGSKKRVKQLREEFDRGIDVTIDESYNPHDVAALLKEFFRDLPEALLTRELYPAFLHTAKLPKNQRLACLRYLVWLLPLTNRDTLHTLLKFLCLVAAHAEDFTDRSGNKIPGNKMNFVNLATIFGPNILHRYKKSTSSSGDNHYQVQSVEKAEENTAVIKVMDDVMSNQLQLFQIPKEDHDRMLRILKESDPEAVDFLLRRKAANYMKEKSRLLDANSPPVAPNKLSVCGPPSTEGGFGMPVPSTPSPTDSNSDPSGAILDEEFSSASDQLQLNGEESASHVTLSSQSSSHVTLSSQSASHVTLSRSMNDMNEQKGKYRRPTNEETHCLSPDVASLDKRRPINGEIVINNDVTSHLKVDFSRVTSSTLPDEDASTTSSISMKSGTLRTMSFTDEDMLAILGNRNIQESELMGRKIEEEEPRLDASFDQLSLHPPDDSQMEESGEHFEKRSLGEGDCSPLNRFDDVLRAAYSSDSGVYTDTFRTHSETLDPAPRRGGFNPVDAIQHGWHEKTDMVENLCYDPKPSVNVQTPSDPEEDHDANRKDSLLDNSSSNESLDCKSDGNVSTRFADHSSNSDFTKETDLTAVDHEAQDNSSVCLSASDNLHSSRRSLDSSVGVTSPDPPRTSNSASHRESLSSVENKTQPRRESSSKVATSNDRLKGNFINGDGPDCSHGDDEKMDKVQSGQTGHRLLSRAPGVSPKRTSPTCRGARVALLADRYNKKDEFVLDSNSNPAPGSRWTSAGFFGSVDRDKRNRRRSANRPSDKSDISWHSTITDRTQLPETLV